MVEASVVLCTQGRSSVLPRAVDALLEQEHIVLEILIVLDGDADALAASLGPRRAAGVRIVEERARGLNVKRNRGIREARAPSILFTDDDCVPAQSWSRRLTDALVRHPVVSGRVVALNRGLRVSLQSRRAPRTCTGRLWELLQPWTVGCGNNLGVRREAFERYGDFCEDLGVGTWSGAACDTEFLFRVLRSRGGVVHYEPRAVVYHRQPRDREPFLHKRRMYYRGVSHMVRRVHARDPLAWIMGLGRLSATAAELALACLSLRASARRRTGAQMLGALEGFRGPSPRSAVPEPQRR